MEDRTIRAIEKALDRGKRVQLKRLADGTIKVQIIYVKKLKDTMLRLF